MPKRHGRCIGSLAVMALAAAGCGGPNAPAFVERDSAGVVVAESAAPAWDASEGWTIEPEPLVEVGQVEGDQRYLFQRVVDAELVGERLVVADGGSLVVRAYELDGTFASEFGGEGEGPGEFRHVGALWETGPGSVGVFDLVNVRITRLSLESGAVETVRIAAASGRRPELFHGVFEDGSYALGWIRTIGIRSATVGQDSMQLGRYSADGSFAGELATVLGLRRYQIPDGGSGVDPFSPFPHARVSGERMYHTDGSRPEVRISDREGRLARLVRWSTELPGRDEAMAALGAALDVRERAIPAVFRLEDVPDAGPAPAFGSMLIDAEGFLWLKRYAVPDDSGWIAFGGAPGGEWWIFDEDGRWLGSVTMPSELKPLSIEADAVVGVRTDALGVQYVQVHRLIRG